MEFLGMDVQQVQQHSERIRRGHERLDDALQTLDGTVRTSESFWSGPDADGFRGHWDSMYSGMGRPALDQLAGRADTLDRDVEEQEIASAADGGGPGAGGGAADVADDGNDRGTVDPEVADAWEDMTDEERRAVAQEIVDGEFEKYGMDPVEISFEEIDGNGLWNNGFMGIGRKLTISEDALSDPDILHTLAHEVRHAAQHEFIARTQPSGSILGDDSRERFEEIEEEYGVTREEIESWEDNFGLFSYKRPPDWPGDEASAEERAEYREEFDEYLDQPVEVDAREGGREFVEDVSLEDLQEFQQEAGVPVSDR